MIRFRLASLGLHPTSNCSVVAAGIFGETELNVFVLCTGRCGSTTFTRAASHISNYTSDHEARVQRLGDERLSYPPNHIEVDNRLGWMLGRLEQSFGPHAFYVHLRRDPEAVARSFDQRWGLRFGIISAYRNGILSGEPGAKPYDICVDLVQTIDSNISTFMADKPHRMDFDLESSERDWVTFWNAIEAEGDLEASLAEWRVTHNATVPKNRSWNVRFEKRYAFHRRCFINRPLASHSDLR